MNEQTDVPVRDAATIVLLRDGPEGLETLMLRRSRESAFGPGAHVFPGGAVDTADADPAIWQRCDGLDDTEASRRIGVARGGLVYWVAAMRECFEESGLLLARDSAGGELAPGRDFSAERKALNNGSLDFAGLCRQADLRLPLDRLIYYSQWTTPAGPPRRFATRFFAGIAPTGHEAVAHDGTETVAGGWTAPAAALAACERGDYPMMPPTLVQIRFLADYHDAETALDGLAAAGPAISQQPVRGHGPELAGGNR